jgi:hypothetical protein
VSASRGAALRRAWRYLVIFVGAVAVLLLVRGSGVMLMTSAVPGMSRGWPFANRDIREPFPGVR